MTNTPSSTLEQDALLSDILLQIDLPDRNCPNGYESTAEPVVVTERPTKGTTPAARISVSKVHHYDKLRRFNQCLFEGPSNVVQSLMHGFTFGGRKNQLFHSQVVHFPLVDDSPDVPATQRKAFLLCQEVTGGVVYVQDRRFELTYRRDKRRFEKYDKASAKMKLLQTHEDKLREQRRFHELTDDHYRQKRLCDHVIAKRDKEFQAKQEKLAAGEPLVQHHRPEWSLARFMTCVQELLRRLAFEGPVQIRMSVAKLPVLKFYVERVAVEPQSDDLFSNLALSKPVPAKLLPISLTADFKDVDPLHINSTAPMLPSGWFELVPLPPALPVVPERFRETAAKLFLDHEVSTVQDFRATVTCHRVLCRRFFFENHEDLSNTVEDEPWRFQNLDLPPPDAEGWDVPMRSCPLEWVCDRPISGHHKEALLGGIPLERGSDAKDSLTLLKSCWLRASVEIGKHDTPDHDHGIVAHRPGPGFWFLFRVLRPNHQGIVVGHLPGRCFVDVYDVAVNVVRDDCLRSSSRDRQTLSHQQARLLFKSVEFWLHRNNSTIRKRPESLDRTIPLIQLGSKDDDSLDLSQWALTARQVYPNAHVPLSELQRFETNARKVFNSRMENTASLLDPNVTKANPSSQELTPLADDPLLNRVPFFMFQASGIQTLRGKARCRNYAFVPSEDGYYKKGKMKAPPAEFNAAFQETVRQATAFNREARQQMLQASQQPRK